LNWNDGQCTYDASVYAGVQFWVRGAGQTRFTLQNLSVRPVALGGQCAADASCFDSHGASFSIPAEWTLMRFEFSELAQAGWGTPVGPFDTKAIYLMEFQFGVVQPFSIAIDDVAFFRDTDAADAGASSDVRDPSAGASSDVSDASGGPISDAWDASVGPTSDGVPDGAVSTTAEATAAAESDVATSLTSDGGASNAATVDAAATTP
jgi:hypothetical protein